jgi:hypothetical protein
MFGFPIGRIKLYNKNCDRARTCVELEVEICATNLADKTKCMSTNAKKWGEKES